MPNIIYGPVSSRRFGQSLGISIVPMKICSFDCLYCELGTQNATVDKPSLYLSSDTVINELDQFMKKNLAPIDTFTLTGYGEPTLNLEIADIAKKIKAKYPEYPLTLLTNSCYLDQSYVMDSYPYFDRIVPSLDAVSEKKFQLMNRPSKHFTAKKILANILLLREKYYQSLELEILFCDGINSSSDEILLLYDAVKTIRPDRVWVNTVDRSPAYPEAKPINESLSRKLSILYNSQTRKNPEQAGLMNLEMLEGYLKVMPMDMESLVYFTGLPDKEARLWVEKEIHEKKMFKESYFGIELIRGIE